MKIFSKISVATAVSAVCLVFAVFGFTGTNTALAASAPSLGAAETFSVLAGLSMSSANNTTVSGDLGLSPGLAVSRTGTWTVGGTEYFGVGGVSATAQADALTAFNNLKSQATSGGWGVDPWSPAPGVWTAAADVTFTGTITLNGNYNDVWIFQVGRDMTFSGSVILAGDAQACHVFWQVERDATIASGSMFKGTLIASRDITSASGATVDGRLISLTSSLAMNGTSSTISGPTCLIAPIVPGGGTGIREGNINVVKLVINDNGGTKTVSDFPLFVDRTPVNSGETNSFLAYNILYTVSETADPNYSQSFSGDCDASGQLNLAMYDNSFCIITNDDIGAPLPVPPVPPLIEVVKVPKPLALPAGPGLVKYTYTLRNVGTVPVTDITMVGDTCSPIALISGDTNTDAKLDVTETWTYTCSTRLEETHTNVVVATGWANGLSATDIASATVVVGEPLVPPLIHVTKVPSPLVLLAGGGMVTYTEKITNPGTVALSNVRLTDDKCSPMKYISGDTNSDSKLDTTETWTYTCRTNLSRTTTNTAMAFGEANGFTVRDLAVATVVVEAPVADMHDVPTLPNTGSAPAVNYFTWPVLMGGALVVLLLTYFIWRKRIAK